MKAVLISIQPGLCELIASGKKTVEIRKTMPLLPTPFKAYIYETKDPHYENLGYCWKKGKCFEHAVGKVIGEFTFSSIKNFSIGVAWSPETNPLMAEQTKIDFPIAVTKKRIGGEEDGEVH